MSYDIEVYTKNPHYKGNYTSDVGLMYHEAYRVSRQKEKEAKEALSDKEFCWSYLNWNDFKDALNANRHAAIVTLEAMIEELKSDPKKYEAMEPDNGRGSYSGAVLFLEGTYKALMDNKNAEMHISK